MPPKEINKQFNIYLEDKCIGTFEKLEICEFVPMLPKKAVSRRQVLRNKKVIIRKKILRCRRLGI